MNSRLKGKTGGDEPFYDSSYVDSRELISNDDQEGVVESDRRTRERKTL